ncbi:MAG: hypothetical protein V1262_13655, partial [Alphaproteobacteria bacterium]|nr:hypothetical protein [Alphaproteobacteria bacterium]
MSPSNSSTRKIAPSRRPPIHHRAGGKARIDKISIKARGIYLASTKLKDQLFLLMIFGFGVDRPDIR